jgi:DNA-directed RNA polymerase specialized sigma24 family protein
MKTAVEQQGVPADAVWRTGRTCGGWPASCAGTAREAETRRQVVAALAGLPDRYRTAVLLKDGRSALREGLFAPQSR